MIKDIVVNLQQQAASDPARDFAMSVAKHSGRTLKESPLLLFRTFLATYPRSFDPTCSLR
jgi:hypothetical protein